MQKKIINSQNAPAAIGPYSQGVEAGGLIFISGQMPVNPATGEIIYGDIKRAAAQCIENIKSIAESAGCSLDNVIKTTLFIKDMDQFSSINEIYGTYFRENQPARSTVQVARLPKDVDIEVEAVLFK